MGQRLCCSLADHTWLQAIVIQFGGAAMLSQVVLTISSVTTRRLRAFDVILPVEPSRSRKMDAKQRIDGWLCRATPLVCRLSSGFVGFFLPLGVEGITLLNGFKGYSQRKARSRMRPCRGSRPSMTKALNTTVVSVKRL